MKTNLAIGAALSLLASTLPGGCQISAAAATTPTDLADYHTTATAVRATPRAGVKTSTTGAVGYLGIEVATNSRGRLVISAVAGNSPAADAGLAAGDVLVRLDGTQPRSAAQVQDWLQLHEPGEALPIKLERGRRTLELTAKLGAVSRPYKLADQRGVLGVTVTPLEDAEGARVTRITTGLPADKAGLKTGDVLVKLDDETLSAGATLGDLLASREAGEKVRVNYRRGDDLREFEATLVADEAREPQNTFSQRSVWKRDTYRLAVIGVAFSDTNANPAIPIAAWEDFFFSVGKFSGTTNATGQAVFGSVNDYYREVSCGRFRFTGKVFDWVKLSKTRADYSQGTANSRTRT